MPLTRGRILEYDAKRMAFQFTMLNEGETIECAISGAAMDELSGRRGTLRVESEAQFLLLRDAIERIASDNFDHDRVEPGGVSGFLLLDGICGCRMLRRLADSRAAILPSAFIINRVTGLAGAK